MLRHVVMLRWSDAADAPAVQAVEAALSAIPDQIDSIRAYRFGSDIGISEGNWDFVVVADFEDEAGYGKYRDHEAHHKAIADFIKPILGERSAIQYQI